MGLWNWLGRVAGVPDMPPPRATFSESAPKPIDLMWREMFGGTGPVSRKEALSVPAIQKGRNLLCSISTLPVLQKDALNNRVRNPLLEQFDPDVANVVHMAQTVEDLVFDAIAWWRVTGFGFDGYPMTVRRLEPASVSLDPPGGRRMPAPLPSGQDPREAVVYVDGEPVSVREIIRFDSPNPAVLDVCARSIRRAIRFDRTAEKYARNQRPLDYFTPTDGVDPADDDDIKEILADWAQSRQTESTAYVPAALSYNTVETATPADLQLVQLQQQVGLDLANALGVDPEDLGISTTSRSYANIIDRRRDRINDVLSPYMRAITDRLSMGDVTKRGYRVEFDLTDYMKSNPTERWMTYEKGLTLGVYTVEEVRQKEGEPPLPADEAPPDDSPAPAEPPATPDTEDPTMVDATAPLTGVQFDEQPRLRFADVPVAEFSVDVSKRTIEGIAMPYGKVGTKYGMKFRFERGSLQYGDPSRIKLLRDHDYAQPLGYAESIKDTPQGVKVRFKVARGAAGDDALQLAEDRVLDGLSVGVDFNEAVDTVPDPKNKGGLLVRRADWRETSLTPMPAFDDARVTSVAASLTGGTSMDETATSGQAPAAGPATDTQPAPASNPVQFSTEQIEQLRGIFGQPATTEPEPRPTVDPTRLAASTTVREGLPYRFDRGGNFVATDHEFAADIRDMLRAGDEYGAFTDAGKRVMGLLRATFDTDTADINELNPTINRQDMYVDQRDYMYPLWNAINRGAPPNGVQPFAFPKFNTASGLVGDHTEGTEPTAGSFTSTNQTVTPTALSGKASLTREVYDMGGNPAVSTLIYNQMVRGYREGLESATATFLNTLTAATDINLGVAVVDDALADAWDQALAGLAFVRSYDFSMFALEQVLYKAFVGAEDSTGRRLYPILNPQNATGTADARFRKLDLSGVTGTPSWALASTPGAANNSWLFDPSVVWGWASTPQRLEFTAGTDATGGYAPVAMVDIGIFGYKAFANTDIGGVRQVIYDSAA